MALTRKTDGTGAAQRVVASWWNDFYDLLTGVMTDQPVNIANTLTVAGSVTALSFLGPFSADFESGQTVIRSSPTSANLVIQVNGKNTTFWPTGIVSVVYGATTGNLGQVCSNGGGAAGNRIWVGTTDPGALADEGDVWIKA